MKNLDKLTIKEYNILLELLTPTKKKDLDLVTIFELLGEDFTKLSAADFQKYWNEIKSFHPKKVELKSVYQIGKYRFSACLNLTKLKAGQFIDLQTIIQNGSKLEDIISLFLIPTRLKLFRYKEYNYNQGYDIIDVRKEIYENMLICDAYTLSDFFLRQSNELYRVTTDHLMKRLLKKQKRV